MILLARNYSTDTAGWRAVADEFILECQRSVSQHPERPTVLPDVMRDDLLTPAELDQVNQHLRTKGFPPIPTEEEIALQTAVFLRNLRNNPSPGRTQ
jgi:hypothetical protein